LRTYAVKTTLLEGNSLIQLVISGSTVEVTGVKPTWLVSFTCDWLLDSGTECSLLLILLVKELHGYHSEIVCTCCRWGYLHITVSTNHIYFLVFIFFYLYKLWLTEDLLMELMFCRWSNIWVVQFWSITSNSGPYNWSIIICPGSY
jgi:hypothetical protein